MREGSGTSPLCRFGEELRSQVGRSDFRRSPRRTPAARLLTSVGVRRQALGQRHRISPTSPEQRRAWGEQTTRKAHARVLQMSS